MTSKSDREVHGDEIFLRAAHAISTDSGICCDNPQVPGSVTRLCNHRPLPEGGTAYVALSRVRSLEGLHLTAFDPRSVKVNIKCLKEINRLRQLHRKDLPCLIIQLYLPPPSTSKLPLAMFAKKTEKEQVLWKARRQDANF